MNRKFVAAAISVFVLGTAGLALAHARRQQPAPSTMTSKKASAVGLMRSLNTAEYAYRGNFGHFASLDTLLYEANYIHHNNPRVQGVADDGTDIVAGLKAVLVLAPA